MFIIDSSKTIHVTRGDIGSISISATDSNNTTYTFRQGDIVRLMVFKKKAVNEVVLSKSIEATPDTTEVNINLTSEDTRIGDVINKPVDYWYEVELNPDTMPQTLIGYDEDGPKVLRLYPEGVKTHE